MAELLIELFSEEIPARMQAKAAEDFQRLMTTKLHDAGLHFTLARTYVTPRRLALVVEEVPAAQPDVREEKKGPRVGSPQQAIFGDTRIWYWKERAMFGIVDLATMAAAFGALVAPRSKAYFAAMADEASSRKTERRDDDDDA